MFDSVTSSPASLRFHQAWRDATGAGESHRRAMEGFVRLLGVVYFVAFASLAVQLEGLVGRRGLLPAVEYLEQSRQALGIQAWWRIPGIFWLGASDVFLAGVACVGAFAGLAIAGGIAQGPLLALAWFLYLSHVSVGQTFLAFQWDALLLEAGFLAPFVASWRPWTPWMSSKEPSILLVWLFRWLLFRLMLASGCVKLASDVVWRDLTALDYHYWTQPLPLWTAWWMQQAPEFTRRAATALALAIELVAPWLIFLGRRGRRVAFVSLAGLQVLIAATGNYGFFNLLTLALCLPLLGETGDSEVSPSAPALDPTDWRGRARRVSTIGLAAFILALSAPKMVRLFDANFIAPYPLDAVERQLSGFHIVNRYGLFADMTESRPEIVIEISQDGMHWAPLEFRWKPGDLQKRPRFAWFHMPRLDWQMWFEGLGFQAQDDWYASQGAPISERRYLPNRWFQRLLLSLLEAPQPGLRLLGPLPLDAPPQKVRAQVYQYRFTTLDERRETGCWWTREWAGTFVPEIGLNPNPPAKPAL